MEVRDCNIDMHIGPNDAHIQLISDLHNVIYRQLDLLESAYANLKPPGGDIIGIKMEGTSGAIVAGTVMSSKPKTSGAYGAKHE